MSPHTGTQHNSSYEWIRRGLERIQAGKEYIPPVICALRSSVFWHRCRLDETLPHLYARVRRSLPMDGLVSGERHPSPTLALPELRGVVFWNVLVQPRLSGAALRPLRTAKILK